MKYSINKKVDYYFLGIPLLASAMAIYCYFVSQANLDLLNGRYALFMDEQITFDGVSKILHPNSFSMFIDHVIDGGDHRYGRVLWNLSSLASVIPERIWGVSGQIFATRMTQAIIQLAAFFVLSFNFLHSWILRGLALWALVTLPHTPYYATMPKPEPLQLLFLAIFLTLAFKHNLRFGYYWLFLGLAFGAKISVLTVFPLLILIGLLQQFGNPEWVDFPVPIAIHRWLNFFFRLGLVGFGTYQVIYGYTNHQFIALSIGLACVFYPFLIRSIQQYHCFTIPFAWFRTFGIFILGFGIAVPVVLFKIPQGVIAWYGWTFQMTTHGFDDKSNTALTWIKYIFSGWTSAPIHLLIGLLILVGAMVITCFVLSSLSKAPVKRPWPVTLNQFITHQHGILLMLISMCLFIPILVLVKRIWGFYLHVGIAILIVALLNICEQLLMSKSARPYSRSFQIGLTLIFLSLQTYTTFFYMLPSMASELKLSAQRTSTPEFQKKQAEYSYLVRFLNQVADATDKPLKIAYDAYIFLPDFTDQWEVILFYGPFTDWQAEPDLIVIDLSTESCIRFTNPIDCPPPSTSTSHEAWRLANQGFKKYVSTPGKPCQSNLCYVQLHADIPNLLILGKSDLVDNIPNLETTF